MWRTSFYHSVTASILISLIAVPSFSVKAETGWTTAAVQFLPKESAGKFLGTKDLFVDRLSPFDRAARLKTDKDVSESQYLAFAAGAALEWSDSEKARVTDAVKSLLSALDRLKVPVVQISLIKTTGREEGKAAYTRGTAIVLPVNELSSDPADLRHLIAHELYHIISRSQPELRERLYAAIGYVKGPEAQLTPKLLNRKITNPDAPLNDHYIKVRVNGEAACATPILYATQDRYSPQKGGEFFDYIEFRYLLTWMGQGNDRLKDPLSPKLVAEGDLDGLFEQIGRNTSYTIHPEEILAENFAMLVTGDKRVDSPDILKKLSGVFAAPDSGSNPSTADQVCR